MTNQQQFFARIKEGAIKGWHSHKILPSVTAAQAALETGWGGSSLANPPYNNFFGIKAGADWTGQSVMLPTQEWVNGRYITINDSFRVYPTLADSIADHAAFFTNTPWRTNNYRRVVGEMDYKRAAQALQDSGYATDPQYARKLINIVETYNLQSWDAEAFAGEAPTPTPEPEKEITKDNTNPEKVVGGYISNPASREVEDYAITVIGDENGKITEPFLKQFKFANTHFDNYEGREWENSNQLLSGIKTIEMIEDAGNLYKNVIVILGTNGNIDSRYINSLVNIAGRERNIILVDSPAELPDRNKLYRMYENASRQHPNVYYANWSNHSRRSIGSYYQPNGPLGTRITINDKGGEELAKFIVESIFQANSNNWDNYASKPIPPSKKYVDITAINYKDDMLESPEGDSSIYNPTLNHQFGFRPGGNGKIMWIERMYEGSETSHIELIENAIAYMRDHSKPGVQYTVHLRDLPDDISLGDEGIIIDHEFNPPLYIKARVLEITTSDTNPDNNQVVIGNVEEIFPQEKSDIIALQKQLQEQREDFEREYFAPKPVNIVIENSNGNTLSTDGFNIGKNLIADSDQTIEVVNGEATINLRLASKDNSKFTFFGKINDNFIDSVEEFANNIKDEDIIEFNGPIDPETNPQGEDAPNPLDINPIRELKHKSFIVQYINTSGNVIKEEEIVIYDDSTFTHPVIDVNERIDKIEILFNNSASLTVGNIAFLEENTVENENYSKTRLYAKSFVENEEVTHKYHNYQWTRVSSNYITDEQWNDKNKFNITNGINITPEDIEGEESTFIVKSFDEDGVYVSASAETISILSNGKSAYELWLDAGNEGSELDYLLSLQGKDGKNGLPGEPGDDGRTPWTHIAYGNLLNGTIIDFSTEDPVGKEYLGTVTNFEEGNPTDPNVYTWIKIKGEKGEDGASVTSIKEFYITTTSLSPTPTKDLDWKETLQPLTKTNKYLWNYERSILSDGKIIETNPIVIGVYGDSGKDGVGIESITEFYLVSASTTTPTRTDPRWDSTPKITDENNRYLWNREEIKYTDGTIKHIPAAIIGTHGKAGENGKDGYTPIKGTDYFDGKDGTDGNNGLSSFMWIKYSQNANGDPMTSDPTNAIYVGVATTTVNSEPQNYSAYKWTKIKGEKGVPGEAGSDGVSRYLHIRYSNNGTTFTANNGRTVGDYIGLYVSTSETGSTTFNDYAWNLVKGKDGLDGKDGISITSVVEKYKLSTLKEGELTTSGTWINTPSTPTKEKPYLWNYEIINYSSGNPTVTKPAVIGMYAADGTSIVNIEEFYALSTTTSQPAESNFEPTMKVTTETNKYLWNKEVITLKHDDGTLEPKSYYSIIGTHGTKGQNGTNGTNGKTAYQIAVEKGFVGTEAAWITSLKGKDGKDGVNGNPGQPGQNGLTPVTHFAYANVNGSTVTDFNTSTPGSRTHLGTYTQFVDGTKVDVTTVPDPTNPALYTWQKTQGVKGDPGTNGKNGSNGKDGKDGDPANTINLLYNGNSSVTAASYQLKAYTMTEDIKPGTVYTFVLKGSKLASQNFGLWQNGGTTGKGNLTLLREDLFALTFTASATTPGNERLLTIYQPNSATAGPANIQWATLVEGTIPLTHYVASTQQILDDINGRALDVDVRNIEEQVGGLNSEYLTLVQNYNALQKDQADYQAFLSSVEAVANSASTLVNQVNSANAVLQTNLERQAEKWVTQEGFIQFDGNTNSMTITSEMGGTQMVIDDEALRFFSGGEQVAVITNQYLQIDRGIFTMSAQIGRHKFAPLSSNNDHFILSYVSGSIL